MRENRDVRHLQRYIMAHHRVKLPIDEIMMEINRREWQAAAILYDREVDVRINALTVDSLSKEMAQNRIKAFQNMHRQVQEFSDILDVVLQKAKTTVAVAKTVTLAEARGFMETYIKVLQFRELQDIPVLPMAEADDMSIDYSNPTELAQALLNTTKIKDLRITDLEGLKEPTNGQG